MLRLSPPGSPELPSLWWKNSLGVDHNLDDSRGRVVVGSNLSVEISLALIQTFPEDGLPQLGHHLVVLLPLSQNWTVEKLVLVLGVTSLSKTRWRAGDVHLGGDELDDEVALDGSVPDVSVEELEDGRPERTED